MWCQRKPLIHCCSLRCRCIATRNRSNSRSNHSQFASKFAVQMQSSECSSNFKTNFLIKIITTEFCFYGFRTWFTHNQLHTHTHRLIQTLVRHKSKNRPQPTVDARQSSLSRPRPRPASLFDRTQTLHQEARARPVCYPMSGTQTESLSSKAERFVCRHLSLDLPATVSASLAADGRQTTILNLDMITTAD